MLDPPPLDVSAIFDGLRQSPARIASKFFYDARGSALFEEITRLPEYYLTRTERAIMDEHGADIARLIGTGRTIIEFGAGNCEKSRRLCELIQPTCLLAIDVSIDFVERAAAGLRRDFPGIEIRTLAGDLTADIDLAAGLSGGGRLLFYPGSSIGNFDRRDALELLIRMHRAAGGDGALLIGVDLQKEVAVLDAAYNDGAGLTARFNLNILNHVGALTGIEFDPADWRHVAFYNDLESRIEMHLEAIRTTSICWPNHERAFVVGERIHTENSYKYQVPQFIQLLERAGFSRATAWMDARRWFAVVLAYA